MQAKLIAGAVVLTIILGLTAAVKMQYDVVQQKNREIAKFEVEVGSLRAANKAWDETFEKVRQDNAEAQKELQGLSVAISTLQIRYNAVNDELEEAKKRRSVVLRKPTLIERLSNKATKKVFADLECATGDLGKCGGKK